MEENSMNSMMDMMSKMMGGAGQGGMPMMKDMMSSMMPQGLSMVLSGMDKQERLDFVTKMTLVLVDKGCEGLSEEEKKEFLKGLVDQIKPKKKKED